MFRREIGHIIIIPFEYPNSYHTKQKVKWGFSALHLYFVKIYYFFVFV